MGKRTQEFQDKAKLEMSALQAGLADLHANTAQISEDLKCEKLERMSSIDALLESVKLQFSNEAEQREVLGRRTQEFQDKAQLEMENIGKADSTAKERLVALEVGMAKRISDQTMMDERVANLEGALALRCTTADHEQLARSVAALAGLINNNSTNVATAINTAEEKAAQDSKLLQGQLKSLQFQLEANEEVLTARVASLFAKAESLEATQHMHARAAESFAVNFQTAEQVACQQAVNSLNERLSQELRDETRLRDILDKSSKDFQDKAILWLEGLDKTIVAAKHQLATLDAAIAEWTGQTVDIGERVNALETAMALTSSATKFEELDATVPQPQFLTRDTWAAAANVVRVDETEAVKRMKSLQMNLKNAAARQAGIVVMMILMMLMLADKLLMVVDNFLGVP